MTRFLAPLLLFALLTPLVAQHIEPLQPGTAPNGDKLIPLNVPRLTKGQLELIKLEADFSASVAQGGGHAFASWFADDAVTLNNGQPAVLGQTAIAASAQWDPKTYHLSWYPEGAQMGPSNDAGFTWGHYEAVSNSGGKSSTVSGRYITFWKKVKGAWKVALDASAQEPPTLAMTAPAQLPPAAK